MPRKRPRDPEGTPNISPKEVFGPFGDDRLVMADIGSPKSVSNILAHPQVCVSFVDVFRERGFKLFGRARIGLANLPEFSEASSLLSRLAGPDYPIRHVIDIAVTKVNRIWAPSYRLFPDRDENERLHQAYAAYGVRPLEEAVHP